MIPKTEANTAGAVTETNETGVVAMIDELAKQAHTALEEFDSYDQEAINKIVHAMAIAGTDQHQPLARAAIDETGRGLYEDKAIKNLFSTEYIWNSIKYDRTVGVIREDKQKGITEIAEPVGVIAGLTPVTNPTSTTMFKSIISIMTRNPIIFAFHPSAQQRSVQAARVMLDAAIEAGAPKNCIQWIETPSKEATAMLLNHDLISLTLATGGAGMVHSAYSTGKPALGVGPGNAPVYVHKSAKIERVVNDLILSKTFDNGMICASEQALVIDEEIKDELIAEFERLDCHVATADEKKKLADFMVTDDGHIAPSVVGMSADAISEKAGLGLPARTKIILVELDGVGESEPFSREKLCPVLGFTTVKDEKEDFDVVESLLNFGGLGHTAVVHAEDREIQQAYGLRMNACRVIANSPSALGGIGDIYNGLIPSLTLGCGSYGRNSVSHNVSATDLINVKRIAERRNNMQWFKIPPKTYFERYSTQYLQKMHDVNRVFIVTDPGMVQAGYLDILVDHLKQRRNEVAWNVFQDVEPNPSSNTVFRGAQLMNEFKPDCIIALGGGSPMDAAKAMWLFYEHPESSYFGMKQKFMDIRKRTYRFPKLGAKAKFVAIPTTSGTGAECTPFAVITDSETGVKYPLADYAITPDVAIVDAQYVDTMPQRTAADSGMDALTHAIESYVSTMAGMAFANAFLGIVHSLSHKVGGEFDIAHGRTNAIFLPHVIKYNSQIPYKHSIFPKYEKFSADQDLADFSRFMGFGGKDTEESIDNFIAEVTKLAEDLGIEMSLKANGVTREMLDEKIDLLADRSLEDQCTPANPKAPLVSDLVELINDAFEGEVSYTAKQRGEGAKPAAKKAPTKKSAAKK